MLNEEGSEVTGEGYKVFHVGDEYEVSHST